MTAAFNCIRYGMVLAFGVVVGSFLNVCIYRIPRRETIVTVPWNRYRNFTRFLNYDLKIFTAILLNSWILSVHCFFNTLFKCFTCRSRISNSTYYRKTSRSHIVCSFRYRSSIVQRYEREEEKGIKIKSKGEISYEKDVRKKA